MYGRRRVGKTTILQEFSKGHKAIFYSAQEKNDVLALNKKGTEALFCECKFRNKAMPMEEYDDLLDATKALHGGLMIHVNRSPPVSETCGLLIYIG